MNILHKAITAMCSLSVFLIGSLNAEVPADVTEAIKKVTPELTQFAASAVIVSDVKKANTTPLPELASMTNDKWKGLSILSPEVKLITKGELSQFLVKNKPAFVSEIFVSAVNGTKVGFISKPTSWTHLGKPKHDLPMQGKSWTGEIELDESTGVKQIQVALPVLDENKKPIGSIVIGLDVSKITAK